MVLRQVGPQVDIIRLGPVRMWREDLEQVEKLISEAAGGVQLKIRAKVRDVEFEMDRAHDLIDVRTRRIDEIEFRTPTGEILVRFGGKIDSVELRDANMTARGMANELRAMAEKFRLFRLHYWLYGSLLRSGVTTLLSIASATLLALKFGAGTLSGWPSWLIVAGGATMIVGLLTALRPDHSRLIVSSRLESPPFWTRKRDDIAINVVALLVGGVIGYFVNMIS